MKIARPPGPRDRFFGLGLLRHMQRDYTGSFAMRRKRLAMQCICR